MTKRLVFALLLLAGSLGAESKLQPTLIVQQPLLLYSSESLTVGGMGLGFGLQINVGKNLVAQTDGNILWANGNAVATRLAIGYERSGQWRPALSGTLALLFGQRTEILVGTAERPVTPVLAVGLRAAPLRFAGEHGYVSALEVGYGVGADSGTCLEFVVLAAGWRW